MMSPVAECLIAFVFGSVVGLLVQRSRFCNTAALRDAMLFKTFRNTKALLVAMMVLTIGFTGFISIGAVTPCVLMSDLIRSSDYFFLEREWCWQALAPCLPGLKQVRVTLERFGPFCLLLSVCFFFP